MQECLMLRIKDIDLERNCVTVGSGKGEGVWLPYALERKYPAASKKWRWFWLFPSPKLPVDPASGKVRRHCVESRIMSNHISNFGIFVTT